MKYTVAVPECIVVPVANEIVRGAEEAEVCDDEEDEDYGLDSDYEPCPEEEADADLPSKPNRRRGV